MACRLLESDTLVGIVTFRPALAWLLALEINDSKLAWLEQ